MDHGEAKHHPGPHIQPIPPPLEFPFPRNSDELSTSPTATLPTTDTSPYDNSIALPTDQTTLEESNSASSISRPALGERKYPTEIPFRPSTEAQQRDRPINARSATGRLGHKNKSGKPDNAIQKGKRTSSGDPYRKFAVGNDSYKTKGKVNKTSGRLDISVNETANRGYLAKAIGASLQHQLSPRSPKPDEPGTQDSGLRRPDLAAKLSTTLGVPTLDDVSSIPILNIVIMVIGSRGDIQPFLKLGKLLKEDYGHNVRIATHPAFKKFIEEDTGLSFFSVGGDPAELMAFMVKNPGLIPSVSTVRAGEIGRRRDAMFEMFQGFWRACINATDEETNVSNLRMMDQKDPFVADAIIANPPSFAHVHCAERLGIPLHLMFTFPYSPTQQFPHPLANIKTSNVDPGYTNFMSYPLVEMMTWQGLGDLVNRFRVKTLGLEPVSTLWAPGQLFRLKVPYTYMWSPGLIPKPSDWGPEIDIAGFVFLDLASSFKPPDSLSKFLADGEPPVYIGFGSIVVDDPDQFTALIFDATKKAGVRALVSKGWGGLGDEGNTPDNVYMLENTPHDWLFPRVSAVVHHGGAGTTAIGLKCGKPTMIVPFFGDQPFWGAMVARAGAGADRAIPYKELTADSLADGIMQCLSSEAKANAEKLAQDIEEEGDGAKNAVKAFHRNLSLRGDKSMRCCVFQDRVAVWIVKNTQLRLSALAAELLIKRGKLKRQDLRLTRHYEWNDFEGPGEPITGGGAAIAKSAGSIVKGIGSVPVRWAKSVKKHEKHQEQRERRQSSATRRNDNKHELSNPQSSRQPSRDRHTTVSDEKGELSDGGHHGAESKLPAPNTHQPGRAEKADADVVGPLLSHSDTDETSSLSTEESEDNIAQELAEDTGHGLAKSGRALAKVPMDLSLAVAQGFHNAPRLYGDTTVRTTTRISGFHSGLRAAGEEFVFGIYDGVTGLFLQPYHGAKEDGAVGFVLGIGKGCGGFLLKDFAAIVGPVAYTMKGIHKEMVKGQQPTAFIRRARTVQGQRDLLKAQDEKTLPHDERQIDAAWKIICEIREETERHGKEGLLGRIRVKRERRQMEKQGAFKGSVWRAQKVVQDRRKSRFIEEEKTAATQKEQIASEQHNGGQDRWKSKATVHFSRKAKGEQDGRL